MKRHDGSLDGEPTNDPLSKKNGADNVVSGAKAQYINWHNLNQLPAEVELPQYDREKIQPGICHFGPGNFPLAHLAVYVDRVLKLDPNWGIRVVSIRTGENALALKRNDGLYVLFECEDGKNSARVIGSIVDSIYANGSPESVVDAVADERIKLITFTVTAKGYYLNAERNLDVKDDEIIHDLSEPDTPLTIFPYLVRGLERRAKTHGKPVVLMSLDNVEENSAALRTVLLQFIALTRPGLRQWVEKNVDFPVTLVDRITPDVTPEFRAEAQAFLGMRAMVVKTESYIELVVSKTNLAMPPWDQVGVKVVKDCGPHWKRKYYMLNAAHQIAAIPALRLGIRYIREAMQNPAIARLVNLSHTEFASFLPENPKVLAAYADKVRHRFADPSSPDTTLRVAARTTEKVSTRVARAILRGLAEKNEVGYAATFVMAVWALNLGGHDEFGQRIDCKDAEGGMLGDLHRRFLDYARIAAVKTADAPFEILKAILLEVSNRLSDNRFARLASVELFVRRLSMALGYIEKMGLEDAVDPYLAAV
jgi:mannitol-1-phosphate/altronate dehydrogenase